MSHLLMQPLSPEEQQRLMGECYILLGKQVKSYHKHRHMGDNTSVPVELAQELMESIEFTIEQVGGLCAVRSAEDGLKLGQEVLEAKAEKAKSLLDLVAATAPAWQTDCRWEALNCLRRYLLCYDHLHLAHREPDDLFYPILVPMPEGLKGIDVCLFYLNVLWLENQIMAGFDDAALEQLWSRLPTDTLNQCEQVLLNGLGKLILYGGCEDLVFEEEERRQLRALISGQVSDQLKNAAMALCRKIGLADDNYVCTAALQSLSRMEAALKHNNLSAVFL